MAVKRRGLGRGLDALLGGTPNTANEADKAGDSNKPLPTGKAADKTLRNLPIEQISRGRFQPRLDINPDTLQDLANSIKSQGVVQPIVVRTTGPNSYEIIAGERRWRASQLAGLSEIPAVVREVPDEAAVAIALIENIQREELNPLEEALALQRLIDEFDMTHQRVAEAVGRSRTAVTNLLRLLELNEDVKQLLKNGDLEMGHARALLALSGKLQTDIARQVVAKELSVRETENLVRKQQNTDSPNKKRDKEDPNIKRFQQDLSERLGAVVSINHSANGKGKLVITYNSLDELEGIIHHIQ